MRIQYLIYKGTVELRILLLRYQFCRSVYKKPRLKLSAEGLFVRNALFKTDREDDCLAQPRRTRTILVYIMENLGKIFLFLHFMLLKNMGERDILCISGQCVPLRTRQ